MIDEPESDALKSYLEEGPALATSVLALVEVQRAAALAGPSDAVRAETERLLRSCYLVELTDAVLAAAAELASATVRTLDAIHLASALHIGADSFLAYDRRLLTAARERGLEVTHPGA